MNTVHCQARPGTEAGTAGQQPAGALWFNPPDNGESTRRALTRERVIAEALTVIAADGAQALSMRALMGALACLAWRHATALLRISPNVQR